MTKTWEMIQPYYSSGEIALFVILVLAPWCPSQESDRTEFGLVSTHDLGVHVQNHRLIASTVTKRA
jgi:hypothetical protein